MESSGKLFRFAQTNGPDKIAKTKIGIKKIRKMAQMFFGTTWQLPLADCPKESRAPFPAPPLPFSTQERKIGCCCLVGCCCCYLSSKVPGASSVSVVTAEKHPEKASCEQTFSRSRGFLFHSRERERRRFSSGSSFNLCSRITLTQRFLGSIPDRNSRLHVEEVAPTESNTLQLLGDLPAVRMTYS